MKCKLVKRGDEFVLLIAPCVVKVVSVEEIISFLFNYETESEPEYIGSVIENLFDYEGEVLLTVDDDKNLTIYNTEFLRDLFMSHFPYNTTAEFAEIHGRQKSIVQKNCGNGRINGAIQVGSTWYILKGSGYPKDERAGRDMSSRYSKKKNDNGDR